MARMTGGEAIAEVLRASGVEYVFGMSGGQTPFTVSVIAKGIRMMTIRSEKCGSLMATGYSRVSGKPGICTAADIGAAHLALGLHEAYRSGIPVVAITSDVDPARAWRATGNFVDQEALFGPITKWMVRAEALETLPEIVRSALRVATTGSPGPVSVIVPDTLLGAEADFEIHKEAEGARYPGIRLAPEAESIKRASELLLEARNPAILAGGGIMLSQASEELEQLAELLVIPVATTHIAHGAFPNGHPLSLGVLGGPVAHGRGRVANRVVGEADVVLMVGTRADGATTRAWTIPSPNSKLVQIDIDPAGIGSNYPVEVGIVADARLALRALAEALRGKVERVSSIADTAEAKEISDLTKEWQEEFTHEMSSDAIPIKTPRLFREIQSCIDQDTIVVLDAGSCSYWAANYLDATPQNQVLHPRGFPALGSGLPMAMGAQVAEPDKKVICISGDGAFGYNIMELETAVRLHLPVVNIVLNNQTLGMERRGFLEFCGETPPEAVSFTSQDFSKIAQTYNCFGARVERPQDIREAVTAALASGVPSIVDVLTDPEDSDSDNVPWR